MDEKTTATIQLLQYKAASLLLYQSVLEGDIGRAFLDLLQALCQSDEAAIASLQAYGRWFAVLAHHNQCWQEYLLGQILIADNPFTQKVQQTEVEDLPAPLVVAVRHDLQTLQHLYRCSGTQLCQWVQAISPIPVSLVAWEESSVRTVPSDKKAQSQAKLREKLEHLEDWAKGLGDIAEFYRQFGTGLFGRYHAFRWQSGQLLGLPHPDGIRLDGLAGYESPKAQLLKNTEFLLQGYPALHVLLYGSRGSGKSSLVKALVQEYGHRGLRLIEVAKSDLIDLPNILDLLRNQPQKFIIFVDDLSFEEDDDAYKALKVILEGNLTQRPPNVVVYATSNRRHLIREFFGDRPRPKDGDEVHAWDTVQEKLSFSDRFGLTLTFEPADQKTYLAIVRHLATKGKIPLDPKDLDRRALKWATRHNGRSGRSARQFVDFLSAELAVVSEQ